jgi:hypothetical protein
MTLPSTALDDVPVWHKLILDFVNHPMNYGSDVHAVGSLARAAGIDPQLPRSRFRCRRGFRRSDLYVDHLHHVPAIAPREPVDWQGCGRG